MNTMRMVLFFLIFAGTYNLKSATKLFSVLLASKRPLITELGVSGFPRLASFLLSV